MKTKWIIAGAAVVLAIGTFAAYLLSQRGGRQREPSHAVTIPLEGDIQTLDPAALSDPTTSRVVWQIYEGLVGLNAENSVVPMLAESWNSPDGGRTWIFRVRANVLFHPNPAFAGEEQTRAVRAEDVVWSVERLARGFGSFVFGGLVQGFDEYVKGEAKHIKGLTATAENEITFALTRNDPSFLYRITSPYLGIMPREVVEAYPDAFGKSVAVGTGPFRLVKAGSTEVVLERNPRYWHKTAGNIDRVTFRVEKNPQFRISGMKAGAYDLVALPTELRREWIGDGGLKPEWSASFRLFVSHTYNVHLLAMDAKQVADASLRRAISLAVDRDAIATRLLVGGATPARGPVPPGMQEYESPRGVLAGREAARRELAKSPYAGEELVLLVANVPNHPDVAQVVQDDLLKTGIKTRIEQVDFNTLVARVFGSDRPPLFLTYSEWIYAAPELLMDQFRSTAMPNPNLFGYSDERVDALIARLGNTSERRELNRLCGEIESVVAEAPPAAWLYHETHAYVAKRGLSNFAVTGNNHWLLSELRSAP